MSEMTSFTTREVPWMKLGKIVEQDVDVERALKLGGLDFTVSLRDIQFATEVEVDAEGKHTAVEWASAPSRKAVVRNDTGEFYDVVSADYSVMQYAEAMSFLSHVNPRIAAAGTLKGGRQGFMVVQVPDLETLPMQFEDEHEMFAVVRTSHDRTRAIEVAMMPLRTRCMNELGLPSFTKNAPQRWSVHHIGDVKSKLHSAEQMIENVKAYRIEFAQTANRLYSTVLDTTDATKILNMVIRKAPGQDEVITKILDLWMTRE